MAAPKGNNFWKNRTKHGRDKIFSTPEILWDEACKYFQWADDNPWVKHEAIKSGELAGQLVVIPTSRPYTLSGLCLYLGVNSKYFNDFKKNLKEDYIDFSEVLTHIEEIIYTQKFEGAAIGMFNSSIIARDLGLSDKKELDHTTKGERINIISLGNGEAITKTE